MNRGQLEEKGGLKWGRGGLREEQPLAAVGIMQTGVTTSSCKGVVPDMEIPDMGGLQTSSLHFPAVNGNGKRN